MVPIAERCESRKNEPAWETHLGFYVSLAQLHHSRLLLAARRHLAQRQLVAGHLTLAAAPPARSFAAADPIDTTDLKGDLTSRPLRLRHTRARTHRMCAYKIYIHFCARFTNAVKRSFFFHDHREQRSRVTTVKGIAIRRSHSAEHSSRSVFFTDRTKRDNCRVTRFIDFSRGRNLIIHAQMRGKMQACSCCFIRITYKSLFRAPTDISENILIKTRI